MLREWQGTPPQPRHAHRPVSGSRQAQAVACGAEQANTAWTPRPPGCCSPAPRRCAAMSFGRSGQASPTRHAQPWSPALEAQLPRRSQRPHQRRLRERAAPRRDPTPPPRGEARLAATGKPAGRLPHSVRGVRERPVGDPRGRQCSTSGTPRTRPRSTRSRRGGGSGPLHAVVEQKRRPRPRRPRRARRNAHRSASRARNPASSYRLNRYFIAVLVLAASTVMRHSSQSSITGHPDGLGRRG